MNTENMTKKVAMFRHHEMGFISIIEFPDYAEDDSWTMDSYIRISEWTTVDFKPLPPETLVEAQMVALSELRARTVDEFTEKLANIDGRMANLRALTGPSAA